MTLEELHDKIKALKAECIRIGTDDMNVDKAYWALDRAANAIAARLAVGEKKKGKRN